MSLRHSGKAVISRLRTLKFYPQMKGRDAKVQVPQTNSPTFLPLPRWHSIRIQQPVITKNEKPAEIAVLVATNPFLKIVLANTTQLVPKMKYSHRDLIDDMSSSSDESVDTKPPKRIQLPKPSMFSNQITYANQVQQSEPSLAQKRSSSLGMYSAILVFRDQ